MTLAQIQAGNIGGLPGYQSLPAANASTTLETIISNTLGFLTIVGGLSFIIYTVLAGLTWITAREEGERLSKAKQMFTNALIGLALVVISWALAGVVSTVFGFKILNPAMYIEQIAPGGGSGNNATNNSLDSSNRLPQMEAR